jgi:hypothetical protein
LTSKITDFIDLGYTGRIKPTKHADFVILDPDRTKALVAEAVNVNDLSSKRLSLIEGSDGSEHALVGGEVFFAHDEY